LKDRHAVTSQWFSVHLPGQPDPDPGALAIDSVEVLEYMRHSAKLRTGALVGNRFRLVIRELAGDIAALDERLQVLTEQPVPNYFGMQRFGLAGGNLNLLAEPGAGGDRNARSFGLSAFRSAMFNLWLAQRIDNGSWREPLSGEILSRQGDAGFVHVARLAPGEMAEPTGLLWGAGDNQATGEALAAERAFFDSFPFACATLEDFDTRMMRRPLAMHLFDLDYELCGDRLELRFSLARGQFATTAIRELGDFADAP
jgi:tRNA pseudouridine13 synthase